MPFEIPTLEQWRALAEKELAGADFERRLVWRTPEEIPVQPLYTPADLAGLEPVFAGSPRAGWQIRQDVPLEAAAEEVSGGAESVCLQLEPRHTLDDLDRALSEIPAEVPVALAAGDVWLPAAALLVARAERRSIRASGVVCCDPLSALVGGAQASPQTLLREARLLRELAPAATTLTVSSHVYHDAGASAVQELAFALAGAADLARRLEGPAMEFHFSVSGNVAMEIAKLRAARLLWARIASLLELEDPTMWLHLRSSRRDKSSLDPHTNLIRAAVESLVGAVGGCDSMHLDPFDRPARPPGSFSRRLARNQQLLLREEAGLGRVADPAGGSYLIESLTRAVARAAWELLRRVEAQGGMLAALEIGWPQREIREVAAGREMALRLGDAALVGVSRYSDPGERPLAAAPAAALDEDSGTAGQADPLRAARDGASLGAILKAVRPPSTSSILALPALRLAEPFEALRERARRFQARIGSPPRAALLPLGSVSARKARAGFASGFLAMGGFEVLEPAGFEDLDQAVAFCERTEAPVVVVCSADSEYSGLVGPLAARLKGRCLVVAGWPQDRDLLKSQGAEHFVHLRCDRIETLSALFDRVESLTPGGVCS